MTRLRRIATLDRYFFVTTNLARNCSPLSSAERDVLLQVVAERRSQGEFWLYGYCVMPTHLHLLLRPNNHDLAAAMNGIKAVTNTRIVHARKTRVAIWQPKYFDNITRRVRDFWAKLEYIHNNPVAAGLAATPRDWKWSSYLAFTDCGALPIPLDVADLPQDLDALLW
jgi:REP-associated tyrosine transposase